MTASHAIHVSIHTTVGLFRMVAFERRDLPPLGDEKNFFQLAPAYIRMHLSLFIYFIYPFLLFISDVQIPRGLNQWN